MQSPVQSPGTRDRYSDLVTATTHAVLDGEGTTPASLRWSAFHHRLDELPPELRDYVTRVARQAWRVSDEDVAALRRAGHSEDAIFEVTAAAALGAAIVRLERGLNALHGSRP